jgi:hypothetical protein
MISAQRKLFVFGVFLAVLIAASHGFLLISNWGRLQASVLKWLTPAPAAPPPIALRPPQALPAQWNPNEPLDYINRVEVQFGEDQRYGITCPRLRDGRNPEAPKRLTGNPRGTTNSTCLRVEGYEYQFGTEIPGVRWVRDQGRVMKGAPVPGKDRSRAWQSIWETEYGRIRVTQRVEIILGEQSRLYDTVLVNYHIWNRDRQAHNVGLRVLLDTLIGSTDAAPFYVPPVHGKPEHFVDSAAEYPQRDLPEFVCALEKDRFQDPDLAIAVLGLNVRHSIPLDRLVLCDRPDNPTVGWKWDHRTVQPSGKLGSDVCAVLYWDQCTMKPTEQRELAFTYGLGKSKSDVGGQRECPNGGRLRLFCAGASTRKPFPIILYVKAADPDQIVTLHLPEGMTLAEGQQTERPVPPPGEHGYAQVTWLVKASKAGQYSIRVEAPGIGRAEEPVRVIERGAI